MTLNVCEKYYALNENFKLWPSFLQIILKQFFSQSESINPRGDRNETKSKYCVVFALFKLSNNNESHEFFMLMKHQAIFNQAV